MPTLSGKVGPPALIEVLRDLAADWDTAGADIPNSTMSFCANQLRMVLSGYEAGGYEEADEKVSITLHRRWARVGFAAVFLGLGLILEMYVRCDDPECVAKQRITGRRLPPGWSRKGNRAFCPAHTDVEHS